MKLGEFEYQLIASAVRLGEKAYGAVMLQEIQTYSQRDCSLGALYTTLNRLEAKAMVETWMAAPTPERGGRSKRMVRVTPRGIEAATAFYSDVLRSSRGTTWEYVQSEDRR